MVCMHVCRKDRRPLEAEDRSRQSLITAVLHHHLSAVSVLRRHLGHDLATDLLHLHNILAIIFGNRRSIGQEVIGVRQSQSHRHRPPQSLRQRPRRPSHLRQVTVLCRGLYHKLQLRRNLSVDSGPVLLVSLVSNGNAVCVVL